MLSIQLHQLQFRAYHGLHEEEKINGNDFEVDAVIHYHPQKIIQSIDETINYEEVYKLIETRMQKATPLLETIAMEIAHEILNKFLLAEEIKISIKKINPPIKNLKGSVGVSFEFKRR
jgi:7,8-dihydroneopterin aldolase/epimerase/oxygenase